jgi:hypothetical protein
MLESGGLAEKIHHYTVISKKNSSTAITTFTTIHRYMYFVAATCVLATRRVHL